MAILPISLGILASMQLGHFNPPNSRTRIEFAVTMDWRVVCANWAKQHGFSIDSEDESADYLYKRQTGMFAPAVFVRLRERKSTLCIETWLDLDPLTQMLTLFNCAQQSGLESHQRGAEVERANARLAVNRLLEQLGLQKIP